MKTIIYILIALILSSIFISSIPKQDKTLENTITLQCVDNNVDISLLNQSASILKDRLSEFSSEKNIITVIPAKDQIQIRLSQKWNLDYVEELLIQEGDLAFYETYNQESLSTLLNDDNKLYSLLNVLDINKTKFEIACVENKDLLIINSYLNSLESGEKNKFAWSHQSNSNESCLYALKLISEKGALINNEDIESVNYKKDDSSEMYSIEIVLQESAVELWSATTKQNLNHVIAIVLDNNVIYAPMIKSVIPTGKCSITGDFTKSQAQYFTAIGNNGKLPLTFKVLK